MLLLVIKLFGLLTIEVSPSDESATKKVKKEVKRNRREVKNDEGQIEEKGDPLCVAASFFVL